ncbi:hypothetical protein SODALDRAFT_348116 [Sodiomyces alkalinus F11]|uniref:Uncharacterized protein n=1 Tax=Sodiomyces alkalinus (strain CBS 110278 / VKM F-3762 / F11) TaxID=1314773 RepID=A0A3N2Q9D5_SODAK|nr:hypothetical protein SODALDRAFT_348116 [Sodiomyces alkalinus F11]ROT43374.1 hypothetical protein SODALDRAFT_348116 [Sodiomyces alkalinus F11]
MKGVASVLVWVQCLLAFTEAVWANTEKIIFLAPESMNMSYNSSTLDNLHLEILTPDTRSIRRHLPSSFPSAESSAGSTSWLLLYNLTPSRRYEVRVCWAAIQPTQFLLDLYDPSDVWKNAELTSSLVQSRQGHEVVSGSRLEPLLLQAHNGDIGAYKTPSVLFLRIRAVANYYSEDAARMAQVEPPLVDIILDPYVFGILPESLVSTVVYITVVAIWAVLLARRIVSWIRRLIGTKKPFEKAATAQKKTI